MTDKYAVIGNPIGHSKSPQIHAAFAKQTNQNISYEAILAPLDGFEKTVRDLIAKNYKGANVTVPFKFDAFKLTSQVGLKPTVLVAGAVNTLTFNQEGIIKDNTDGYGLVCDIKKNLNCPICNKRVLLIGAGGAAEGVLHPLLEEKPKLLTIVNRNLKKALAMQSKVETHGLYPTTEIVAKRFDDLKDQAFDIIINATSTGLSDIALPIPDSVFEENSLAYDLMYGRETPFMAQARATGVKVADGLGMLVEQAAEAFYLWRGVRPETAPVIAMLRSAN
jgi:shikimate dehydrogenase